MILNHSPHQQMATPNHNIATNNNSSSSNNNNNNNSTSNTNQTSANANIATSQSGGPTTTNESPANNKTCSTEASHPSSTSSRDEQQSKASTHSDSGSGGSQASTASGQSVTDQTTSSQIGVPTADRLRGLANSLIAAAAAAAASSSNTNNNNITNKKQTSSTTRQPQQQQQQPPPTTTATSTNAINDSNNPNNGQAGMTAACSVCSDDQGTEKNLLVYCDGCEVAVHQACYGINRIPVGSWYCSRCESRESRDKARCKLCPSTVGALKRTEFGDWAHVVCALYIPEIRFGNIHTMEPIEIKWVIPERYNKICYLCKEKKSANMGAVIDCRFPNCKHSFHVTCAQVSGLLAEEPSPSQDNIIYCGYCEQHFRSIQESNKSNNTKSLDSSRSSNVESASDSSQDDKDEPKCNTSTTEQDKNTTNSNLTNKPSNLKNQTIASTYMQENNKTSNSTNVALPDDQTNATTTPSITEPAPQPITQPVKEPKPKASRSKKNAIPANNILAEPTTPATTSKSENVTKKATKSKNTASQKTNANTPATSVAQPTTPATTSKSENVTKKATKSKNTASQKIIANTPATSNGDATANAQARTISTSPSKRKSRTSNVESSNIAPSPSKRPRKKKTDTASANQLPNGIVTTVSYPSPMASSSNLITTGPNHLVGPSPLLINAPAPNNRYILGVNPLEGQDMMNRYYSPMISPYTTNHDLSAAPPPQQQQQQQQQQLQQTLPRTSISRLFASSAPETSQPNPDDPERLFDELRDNTWTHLSRCIIDSAQQFDIPSLIGTLYTLRSENEKLSSKVRELNMKNNQLLSINARLDMPGPMLTQHLSSTSPNFSQVVASITNSPKNMQTPSPGSNLNKPPSISIGPYNHVQPVSIGVPPYLDRNSPLMAQTHSGMNSMRPTIFTPSPPISTLMANRVGLTKYSTK